MPSTRTLLRTVLTTLVAGMTAVMALAGPASAHDGVPGDQPHDSAVTSLGLDHVALLLALTALVGVSATLLVRALRRSPSGDETVTDRAPSA